MFLQPITITRESFVSEIVRGDYRTAAVFKKHQIDFCCGVKWALGDVCEVNGLDFSDIKHELERSTRNIQLSNSVRFDHWSVDFLTDYIVNVHHHYVRNELPQISEQLDHFAAGHIRKFPFLKDVQKQFGYLCGEMVPHMAQEEEILFPYLRQISHAYNSKEAYASLLVRTLRKPVETLMEHEHGFILKTVQNMRKLTDNYQPPSNACISHEVTFSLLKELDNDLTQHLYLENHILFPKAIAMEKELLQVK